MSEEMVQGINTGRYWRHDRKYPIRGKEREKIKYYCPRCGKEITKNAKMCRPCYDISNRIVERPARDELKKLIRTMPFVKIGEKYKVSDKAITKWCIAENLPSRKKDIKSYSDEEWDLI
jgi:predicted amidophosphoribosyltransferase